MKNAKLSVSTCVLAFAFACSASATLANTDEALAERTKLVAISSQLALEPYMQGQFNQRRKLEGFTRMLSSTGEFYFWRDQGLYWEVQKPFYRATTFKERQVLSWSAPNVLTDAVSPNMIQRQIGKVLMAVLGTDIDMLSSVFSTESSIDTASGDWSIRLTPKDIATRQMLSHLDIKGKITLDQIIVVSTAGDESLIELSQYVNSSAPTVSSCKKFYPEDEGKICKHKK